MLGLPGRSSGPRPPNPEFAGCHVPARRGCGGHTKLPPLPGDPSRCRPARPPPGPRPCRRRAPPPSASGADQAGDHGTRAVAPLAPSLLASDQRGSDPGPHCEGRSGDTGTARGSGQQGRRGAREDDGQRLASASQHAAPKGAKATVPPRRVWPLQGPQATAGPVGPGDGRGPGPPAGTSPCNPSTRNPPTPVSCRAAIPKFIGIITCEKSAPSEDGRAWGWVADCDLMIRLKYAKANKQINKTRAAWSSPQFTPWATEAGPRRPARNAPPGRSGGLSCEAPREVALQEALTPGGPGDRAGGRARRAGGRSCGLRDGRGVRRHGRRLPGPQVSRPLLRSPRAGHRPARPGRTACLRGPRSPPRVLPAATSRGSSTRLILSVIPSLGAKSLLKGASGECGERGRGALRQGWGRRAAGPWGRPACPGPRGCLWPASRCWPLPRSRLLSRPVSLRGPSQDRPPSHLDA